MLPGLTVSLHVTFVREPAFSFVLPDPWVSWCREAQAGKLFVCFSKFADDLVLCAAPVLGQGNQAARGSAGQVLLAALFSCTGSRAGGFSVLG